MKAFVFNFLTLDQKLYVCLFGDFVPLENLLCSYEDVTITGDGLEILTNIRHSWPLKVRIL